MHNRQAAPSNRGRSGRRAKSVRAPAQSYRGLPRYRQSRNANCRNFRYNPKNRQTLTCSASRPLAAPTRTTPIPRMRARTIASASRKGETDRCIRTAGSAASRCVWLHRSDYCRAIGASTVKQPGSASGDGGVSKLPTPPRRCPTARCQQAREPADATEADYLFEAAVKAFEAGDYTLAITNFEKAATLEPDDVVLGFARVQAFFADGQYDRAAQVLRESIGKMPVDKEGVFFPRGLYTNDDVLLGQVSRLQQQSGEFPADSDRKLLLGYQLLGLEKYGQAVGPLKAAAIDQKNKSTAESLLKLLEKIETDASGKTGK